MRPSVSAGTRRRLTDWGTNSVVLVMHAAYRVLTDPERREKYDLYGIADEQGFQYVGHSVAIR